MKLLIGIVDVRHVEGGSMMRCMDKGYCGEVKAPFDSQVREGGSCDYAQLNLNFEIEKMAGC